MLSLIKRAAVDAVNATYPVRITFARLNSKSPVSVYISQKLPSVSGGFLRVTDTFMHKINDAKYDINVGDEVVLLRMQGGQKFLLLDKVV